jgi:hypothetical protein
VVLERSWSVIVVAALVKENERGGEGHTSATLLHQSATWHCAVNMHCFYMSAFSTSCFVLSAMDGKTEQHVCIKFCMKLGKSANETTFSQLCFVYFFPVDVSSLCFISPVVIYLTCSSSFLSEESCCIHEWNVCLDEFIYPECGHIKFLWNVCTGLSDYMAS